MASSGVLSYPGGTVLPYRFPVSQGGLNHGNIVVVQGWIPKNAKRFEINLICDDDNWAFHLNPRFAAGFFESDRIVRNTKIGNGWGPEEDSGAFPLKKDSAFDIVILVQDDCFRVAINGQHYCEYNHRVMKDNIREVMIDGDVALITATQPRDTVQALSEPAFNVSVPYTEQLPSGIQPGTMIFLAGKIKKDSQRFHINLQSADIGSPYADIALHFNPRFKPKKQVVRNNMNKGKWGDEETKAPGFPFKPDTPFTILILVEEDGFKVAVNHQHYLDFEHRMANLSTINTLYVEGDVMIAEVRTQY
ncbi:unnamed protein product [Owenia fusiformis]|uniref:Uncharacterized protein n=1 Tax=Owenia fusiformis TaxID=6347 RepID=A0A8J1XW38_OWEFU|nr:unnamed protein product [Owenia fusiformis]